MEDFALPITNTVNRSRNTILDEFSGLVIVDGKRRSVRNMNIFAEKKRKLAPIDVEWLELSEPLIDTDNSTPSISHLEADNTIDLDRSDDDKSEFEDFVISDDGEILVDDDSPNYQSDDEVIETNILVKNMTLQQLLEEKKDQSSKAFTRYTPFIPDKNELLMSRIPVDLLQGDISDDQEEDIFRDEEFKTFFLTKREDWPKDKYYSQLYERTIQSTAMMGKSKRDEHNHSVLSLIASNRITFRQKKLTKIEPSRCDGCGLFRITTTDLIVLDKDGVETSESFSYGPECAARAKVLSNLYLHLNSIPLLPIDEAYIKRSRNVLDKLDFQCLELIDNSGAKYKNYSF